MMANASPQIGLGQIAQYSRCCKQIADIRAAKADGREMGWILCL